jgi:hypothetical protein
MFYRGLEKRRAGIYTWIKLKLFQGEKVLARAAA